MTHSLQAAVLASPLPAILLDGSGRILQGNAAWMALVGPSIAQWLDAVHPDDRTMAQNFARGREEGWEIRVADAHRGWRWVLATSFPSEEGGAIWIQPVVSQRDDVLRSLERERELNSLKNRFISLVSHEFRTPLTVILSSAELLEHYGSKWPDERRAQHLHKIHNAVNVMTSLLDNVGLYGRAESGVLQNRPESIDVSQVISEVIQDVRLASTAELDIRVDHEGRSCGVRVDPKLLRHVLANLLANAVKFSTRDQPVDISCRREPGWWSLEMRDRGVGIPAEDAKRVWERFQRGSNVDGVPGTGLGLPIVRRCIEIMEGEVELVSAGGSGTIAVVRIPQAAGDGTPPGEEGIGR